MIWPFSILFRQVDEGREVPGREQERIARAQYQDSMSAAGWRRYEWNSPDFCARREFSPEMNIANLWWRPIQHDLEINRSQLARSSLDS